MKLPSDFAKKIAETLSMTARGVEEFFEVYEDKEGYFIAKPKPLTRWIDTPQFSAMCTLARSLGGDYAKGARAWKIPGPYVKKGVTTSTPEPVEDARSKLPEGLKPEAKKEPSGVAPKVLTEDKSRPPQFTVPLKALLSMPFQCRTSSDDPEMAELTESIKALGVLQPILVRPKPNGLFEIVYGQRRAKAAEKAGLIEIPVAIRFLSDEEAFTLQLTENLQRKDLSEGEKTRALGELAKRTGWNAQQIADKLKMSYTWVTKYLPAEFKDEEKAKAGAIGGETKSETLQHSATRRVAEETQDIIQAGEAQRAAQPEQLSEPMGPTPGHLEPEREPRPEEIDTGFEWTCPECEEKFQLIHVKNPDGSVRHKLEAKD